MNKPILTVFLVLLIPFFASAQFSHRLEILVEKTFPIQFDRINAEKGHIDYYESTRRFGGGTGLGVKYNFRDLPLSLYLGYEDSGFSNYSIESNIDISDESQSLNSASADFNILYNFFRRSAVQPHAFVGINYTEFDYTRTYSSYTYTEEKNEDYIPLSMVKWGDEYVKSDFKRLGVNIGGGVNISLSDKLGISGNIKLRYLPQNHSEVFGNHIFLNVYSIGAYYRLFKRKNDLRL